MNFHSLKCNFHFATMLFAWWHKNISIRVGQNLCLGQVEIWFGWVNLWHDLSKGQAHISLPTNNTTNENWHQTLPTYKSIHSWKFYKWRLNIRTNFNTLLQNCFVFIRNTHERLCNLVHLGLSPNKMAESCQSTLLIFARFIFLLLFKTVWASDNQGLPDGCPKESWNCCCTVIKCIQCNIILFSFVSKKILRDTLFFLGSFQDPQVATWVSKRRGDVPSWNITKELLLLEIMRKKYQWKMGALFWPMW